MTSQTTATIQPEDTIMIRATFGGRTIANIISNGFGDLVDVLRAVRTAVGAVAGCIRLNLRNASKGWTRESTVFMAPSTPGMQLHLF